MEFKSGFIALLGSPNVGKSTLLNALVGTKIAIVSKKPQTTRNRITGVVTREDFQMIFMDPPGLHTPKNKLGEFMVKTAEQAARDVDAVLFVVDAKAGAREREDVYKRQTKMRILGKVRSVMRWSWCAMGIRKWSAR